MSQRGYGVLDVGFAALYAWLGFGLAPSRSPAFQVALACCAALLFVTGVVLLVGGHGSRWGRVLGIAACGVLLVLTATCLVLLAVSVSYLFGVYGAIGRTIGGIAIAAGALLVELFGLLPLFQLRFHLRATR